LATHPSKEIAGTKGEKLKGKHIVLCVTGSVAAVQSPEIARTLMRRGAEVTAVMSEMARKIIHPNLMEWATGNPVVTELTGKIEHVALAGERPEKADLLLIAPATANTISKIACGIDDTTVTSFASTAFGSEIPLLIVPAMHQSMFKHPLLTDNIQKLKAAGVEFVEPRIEDGIAKIAKTEVVVDAVAHRLATRRDFDGLRVLVTAGATIEHIDPVRVITNRSSGKMGMAVVQEALSRGAETTLIYGLGQAPAPPGARTVYVETTAQMRAAVESELKSKRYDVAVSVAAPADWTIKNPYSYKVSTRKTSSLDLTLRPTKKIVRRIKAMSPGTLLAAFSAEYKLPKNELIESAFKKLTEIKADLIVVNDVGKKNTGFRADTNEVFIVDKAKNVAHVPLALKRQVARMLMNIIRKKTRSRRKTSSPAGPS
jgi:phosphopantothenoylcysteine decarboxylase/phosphopantothenate--cysteine ligase